MLNPLRAGISSGQSKSDHGINLAAKEVGEAIMTEVDNLPLLSLEHCIYRVPEKFRRVNAEAYTPQVISIGPIHHDKIELQSTEKIKLRYLTGYLRHSKADLLSCTRMIGESEGHIRQCYQENLALDKNELIRMILLDAVFIVELFIRNHYPQHRDEKDEIFSKQWMSNAVFHDVLLLENQVPFFVPENLYDLTTLRTTVPFFKLSYEYFKDLNGHELANTTASVKHLVDYVRALQLPLYQWSAKSNRAKKSELTRTAKELQEAGVKFRLGEATSSPLDVDFKDGTLVMQRIVVHEWTEVYITNMIAYEQCHHDTKYITSYAMLVDGLIRSRKDVGILISHGILENQLGSADDVAHLFNSMHKGTMRDSSEFFYSKQSESVNNYYRDHRWKAMINQHYFSKPWFRISAFTGGLLVVLTIVQTVCSLIDVYAGDAGRLFRWHI